MQNTLQHSATHCTTLHHTTPHSLCLQRTAHSPHCNALHTFRRWPEIEQSPIVSTFHKLPMHLCVAVCCNVKTLQHFHAAIAQIQINLFNIHMLHTNTQKNKSTPAGPNFPHTAIHCNTLQHPATPCSTLQQPAITHLRPANDGNITVTNRLDFPHVADALGRKVDARKQPVEHVYKFCHLFLLCVMYTRIYKYIYSIHI